MEEPTEIMLVIITRPMKAQTVEIATMHKVEWPMYCSPKVDGIRLLIHPTLGPVTQSFKRVPNVHIYETLMGLASHSYLDGEVYAIDNDGTALFNATQSAVMSRGGQPRFRYAVFDCFDAPFLDFDSRYCMTKELVLRIDKPELILLQHTLIESQEEFLQYVEQCISDGYEGAVLRHPDGIYKSGRSTLNQGWMLKYKEWEDAEGTIIGFEELYHNENPQEVSLLGLSKRSSHGEGKIAAGTLGAFILKTAWGILRIGNGRGMTHEFRQRIWDRNVKLPFEHKMDEFFPPDLGRVITFRYQKHGMQTLPRFPQYKGFRDD